MDEHDLLQSVVQARHQVTELHARLEGQGTAPGSPEIRNALRDLLELLEKLQTRYGLLREILARTDDAVFAKDHDGRYVMINRKGAGMFGKSVEEILGQDDTAIFARENPQVEFRQFQGGGLTSTRAVNRFYTDVLAWKPQQVLLVVINRTDEDLENFRRLGRGLAEAGAKVLTFDDVHDPKGSADGLRDRELAVARETGMTVIEVSPLLASAPDRERFMCLDGIHMTEPYHRLMAKEWLKVLVGVSIQGGAAPHPPDPPLAPRE